MPQTATKRTPVKGSAFGRRYTVAYRFSTDDRLTVGQATLPRAVWDDLARGDTVTVRYDSSDPDRSQLRVGALAARGFEGTLEVRREAGQGCGRPRWDRGRGRRGDALRLGRACRTGRQVGLGEFGHLGVGGVEQGPACQPRHQPRRRLVLEIVHG